MITWLNKNALAIINMLVFVFIFSILAGSVLMLVSSQVRILESNIRRTKAFYVVEAGSIAAYEALRKGAAVSNTAVEWMFSTTTGNPVIYKTSVNSHSGFTIRSNCSYGVEW